MLLKELVILSEGALTRQSDRKREELSRFVKLTTDFSASYDKLTSAKKKRVDDAISGAMKVAKVVGCKPIVIINSYQNGVGNGSSKFDKWIYQGGSGDGSSLSPHKPKTSTAIMKLTGISKQELNAIESLDYRDELIALKAKLK